MQAPPPPPRPQPPQKKTAPKKKFGKKKLEKKIGQSMDFFGGSSKILGSPSNKYKLVKFAM
jgi:hypothetical protein